MTSFKQIVYKREKCIGCQNCYLMAPHIWKMNTTDGKADLLDAELKKVNYFRMLWDDERLLMEQIGSVCPTKAIALL